MAYKDRCIKVADPGAKALLRQSPFRRTWRRALSILGELHGVLVLQLMRGQAETAPRPSAPSVSDRALAAGAVAVAAPKRFWEEARRPQRLKGSLITRAASVDIIVVAAGRQCKMAKSRILKAMCALVLMHQAGAQENNKLEVLPSKDFAFSGSWSCEGVFRKGQVHKATYTGQVVLGGRWLEFIEQDTQPATGYQAKYLIGYDPKQKRLVEFDANTFGAAVYVSEEGWKSGNLIMVSLSADVKASYVADRFIYSIKGVDSFTVDWQIRRTSDFEWVTSDHLVCTKAPTVAVDFAPRGSDTTSWHRDNSETVKYLLELLL